MRATILLILLCFSATFHVWSLPSNPEYLVYSYHNLVHNYAIWTLITTLFIHANLSHLLGNMLFLFLFGWPLEKIIGSGKLMLAFLLGGILSLLLSHFFYAPEEPIVGASGSICALIATLMIFDPWRFSFLLILFPMPLAVAGLTYVLYNFVMAIYERHHPDTNTLHVAYEVHVAGFIVGLVLGCIWNPGWKKNLLTSVLIFIGYYTIVGITAYLFLHHR
jgi:membrane associated rhomboid family serine protease